MQEYSVLEKREKIMNILKRLSKAIYKKNPNKPINS